MGRLNGDIDDDLHAWFRAYAASKGRSMVSIVEQHIKDLREKSLQTPEASRRALVVELGPGVEAETDVREGLVRVFIGGSDV
jgi:vacuolar-type H+-ATPase subunit F/Vma7